MAHVEKFTRSQVPGIANHIERKTQNHSNKDIDTSKSHLNYSLLNDESNMNERLQARLSEVSVLNRKNVNVIADWIVTLPESLVNAPERDIKSFFESNHEFLVNRYGGLKNVVSSEVHMDETTPHLHFAFIPVVFDEKRQGERVNAKAVIDRKELQSFHGDLDEHLKQSIPDIYKNDILNGKTLGLDSVEQIKLHNDIIQKAKDSVQEIEIDYEAKKAYVSSVNRSSEITKEMPDYAVVKKKPFSQERTVTVPLEKWEERHVAWEEKNAIKKQQETYEKRTQAFQGSLTYERYQNLVQQHYILQEQFKEQGKQMDADKKYTQLGRSIDFLFEQVQPLIKKYSFNIQNFFKKIKPLHSQLSDFGRAFTARSLETKKLPDLMRVGVDSWNNGFDYAKAKYTLCESPEEYQNKMDLTKQRNQNYEMSM